MDEIGSRLVVLGQIGAPYGTRGWVRVKPYTEKPEQLLTYEAWMLRLPRGWTKVRRIEERCRGERLLVRLSGCESPEQAAVFRNAEIGVDRASLPEPTEGEYYWHQLQGLSVYSSTGEGREVLLGRVDRIFATGANDVIVGLPVEGSVDDRERLIPWLLDRVILRVEFEQSRIVADWDPDY